jgi:hypothetical protein
VSGSTKITGAAEKENGAGMEPAPFLLGFIE